MDEKKSVFTELFAVNEHAETQKSVFSVLNAVNVNEHTEKKNGLTYLSWAWAWQEVKKRFPDAKYTIYERPDGVNYWTDGRTCWVKTGITICGLEHIEELPVMDYKNAAIPLERVTSTDVNKAIQRSLTKACARHGLGLYIYAGEDLPESEQPPAPEPVKADSPAVAVKVAKDMCTTAMRAYKQRSGKADKDINNAVREFIGKNYKDFTADDWRAAAQAVESWQ